MSLEWQISEDGCYYAAGKVAELYSDTPEYGRFRYQVDSGIAVRSLYAQFEDFSESLALRKMRKTHSSADGKILSIDIVDPIPFGDEPEVKRVLEFDGENLTATMNLAMRHSYKMGSVSAGGLEFTGKINRIAIIRCPSDTVIPKIKYRDFSEIPDGEVLFDSEYPPLQLIVAPSKGAGVRFELGEDIWRWSNAARISGVSRYLVVKENNTVRFVWQLYTFKPADEQSTPPDGREWRLRFRLLRMESAKKKTESIEHFADIFDVESYSWPTAACAEDGQVCFSSSVALNILKKWIRGHFNTCGEGDILAIVNVHPHICHDAAHQDRAKLGTLSHWDIPVLADFSDWANRQLARYGAVLKIQFKQQK